MSPKPNTRSSEDFAALLAEIRACRVCAASLPLGPRPVLHASPSATLLIASQAPGRKVHEAGISFWDASGDRLRAWLGLDKARFYDESRIAIVPTGLCYPGRLEQGGDAPPRPECHPLWSARIRAALPNIKLTLLVGTYAQVAALGPGRMTDRVRNPDSLPAGTLCLPHPSWRTGAWERRNPWFSDEILPRIRRKVAEAIA